MSPTSEARVRQKIERERDAQRWRAIVEYLHGQSAATRLLEDDGAALVVRVTIAHWYHRGAHEARVRAVVVAGERVVDRYTPQHHDDEAEAVVGLDEALAMLREETAEGSYATRREP